MADVAIVRTLKTLKAAGNPVRLEILLHAAANRDHVRPTDAKPFMTSSPRTSTVQYHFRVLVDALLLEKVGWGEYRLTRAGRQVSRLATLLANGVDEDADGEEPGEAAAAAAMTVTVHAEGAVAGTLRESDDLVAVPTRTLAHGRVERSPFE
jgi:hypothetical protein